MASARLPRRLFAALALALAAGCGTKREEPGIATLHLFDQPPVRVEIGPPPDAMVPFLAQDEVLVEESIRAGKLERFRPRPSPRHIWLWTVHPTFSIVGEPRLLPSDGSGNLETAEITSAEYPEEAGWMIVGPAGIIVASERDERPEDLRVTYRAPSRDIALEMVSPRKSDADLPLHPSFQHGYEARRASVVGASSRLAWKVLVPDRATFEVGLTVQRRKIVAFDGRLQVEQEAGGQATARVEVHVPGEEPSVLYEERVNRRISMDFEELVFDLAAFAGREVEVHLVTEPIEPRIGSFPVWAEPVVVDHDAHPRSNVLLIVLDTLRADRLGCYGSERAHTPYLDSLAKRGVRFERAISGAPWTLPSHATLFTSLHTSEHGVHDRDHRLSEDAVTLAEVLRAAGYRTGAVAEGGFVIPKYGLAQGFDSFRHQVGEGGRKDARKTFDDATEWMSSAQQPFFSFVQTYLVHSPYDPPEPWRSKLVRPYEGELPESVAPQEYPWCRGYRNDLTELDERYISDLYDAEIAYLDDELGRFLDGLDERGLLDDTIVIVTSDHGDEFADHGQYEHGLSLYEEQLHVPLIVWQRGRFEGGRTVSHPVNAVDVAPSVASWVGLEPPPEWSGSVLRWKSPDRREPLFTPYYVRGTGTPAVSVRLGELKYIDYPADERFGDSHPSQTLFDLATDPGERANLLEPDDLERWQTAAEDLRARYGPRLEVDHAEISPALQAELRALGYVDDGG